MDPERAKQLPGPVKRFYKGEPMVLGIAQILLGILTTTFGVILNVGHHIEYHLNYINALTPHWTGVLFIISGSLSVSAARNPKISLVKGMLGMNVVSIVAAGVAIIFISFSLEIRIWHYHYLCSFSSSSEVDAQMCREIVAIPYKIINGIMVVLLVFSILELCISLSIVVYGCKAICNQTWNKTVVVVYQSVPPKNADGTPVSGSPESYELPST